MHRRQFTVAASIKFGAGIFFLAPEQSLPATPPTVLLAALIATVVLGDPRRYSGDWQTAMAEEQRAQRERQEREARDREAKAREHWHGPRWWEGERA